MWAVLFVVCHGLFRDLPYLEKIQKYQRFGDGIAGVWNHLSFVVPSFWSFTLVIGLQIGIRVAPCFGRRDLFAHGISLPLCQLHWRHFSMEASRRYGKGKCTIYRCCSKWGPRKGAQFGGKRKIFITDDDPSVWEAQLHFLSFSNEKFQNSTWKGKVPQKTNQNLPPQCRSDLPVVDTIGLDRVGP